MYTLLGIIANLLYGWACIGMAWKTLRYGRDIGNPLSTMWIFTIANASFAGFVMGTYGFNWLLCIQIIETVCWGVALWYHYFPRSTLYVPQEDDQIMRIARRQYENRPCAPQCLSECDGVCAEVLRTGDWVRKPASVPTGEPV